MRHTWTNTDVMTRDTNTNDANTCRLDKGVPVEDSYGLVLSTRSLLFPLSRYLSSLPDANLELLCSLFRFFFHPSFERT